MKRTLLFLTAAACLLAGCARSQKFTVSGSLETTRFPAETDSVRIESELLPAPILAPVVDDAFSLKGKIEKPFIAKLRSVGTEFRNTRLLILEEGDITFADGQACGTPLNDANRAFTDQLQGILQQYADRPEEKADALEAAFADFVTLHKNDPCAAYAILMARGRLEPEAILKLISSASPEIRMVGDIHSLAGDLKKAVKK